MRNLIKFILILEPTIEDTKWCKFDDVFVNLLQHFATENESKTFLLYQIAKFCDISRDEKLMSLDEILGLDIAYFEELKKQCNKPNTRLLRWLKPLTSMINSELQNTQKSVNILQLIYILTMFHYEDEFKEYAIDFSGFYQ